MCTAGVAVSLHPNCTACVVLAGKPDFAKGSFYANPLHDKPVDDEELIKKCECAGVLPPSPLVCTLCTAPSPAADPAFLEPNIWPTEHLPTLEGAFKDLGNLIVSVGRKLAVHCDAFVAGRTPSYPSDRLAKVLTDSRMCKARLLYYFPRTPEEAAAAAEKEASLPPMDAISSWCGWHNDHGSLTGLCQAMYLDEGAGGAEVPNPDPAAGLYIRSRQHQLVKLKVPPGSMAFQIGESAQIHTGGVLQATPHSVRAARQANIGRATLAVFMEPEWNEPMAPPAGQEGADKAVTRGATGEALPPGVPALEGRWAPDMDFGQFTDATLAAYY